MRHACRTALAAAGLIFAVHSASDAQTYPNALSADSVHPALDSVMIRDMRARMDSIHRLQHRPTVALVLSGGGAKGSAHVGVLRMIEEIGLPVDMVCGTSMGGLIGSLFSLGYTPSFIDSLIRNMDWGLHLSDRIDSRYISYNDKMYDNRFLMSIPFRLREEIAPKRVLEEEKYSGGDGVLRLGGNPGELNTQSGISAITSSLPSGYVFGFNVNNLFSSLTVGYQDSISFRNLPIPFFCVASDIVSCKAKNWGSGSIKAALRSTMSIPGLFDPVRTHGMVLVDGGTRNNFPVDLARAMGADLVIGVDLSDMNPTYSQINNLVDVLSQFVTMLSKDAFDRNKPEVDVFIKPDLHEYNMMSFSAEDVAVMIQRGYEAAKAQEAELREIKSYMRGAVQQYWNKPATDIDSHPVQISRVVFDGVKDNESLMLQNRIGIKAGAYVSKGRMDVAMSEVLATGAFESVTYSLLGDEAPYMLVFNCVKKPVHQFGLGFRADNDELASLLVNLGLNSHNLTGHKLDFTAKVGANSFADLHYSFDMPGIPTVNIETCQYSNSGSYSKPGVLASNTFMIRGNMTKIFLSNLKWTNFDLQVGMQYRRWRLPMKAEYSQTASVAGDVHFGIFGKAVVYTLDSENFPTRGFKLIGDYSLDFASGAPMQKLGFDMHTVIPMGEYFAMIPRLHTRNVTSTSFSPLYTNYVGGAMHDRNVEGQIPFVGFDTMIEADDHVAVADLDLRAQIAPNFFLSAMGGVMIQSPTLTGMLSADGGMYWYAGAELGYRSILGPARLNVHWSDLTRSLGYYLSLGYDF